jgi:glycerophosphoryl diester phosphodiesterase
MSAESGMRIYGGKRVYGHRGLPRSCPENTLASFRAAADAGATGVELDLRLTADGEVVILHDERLERTTDGQGAVEHRTRDEIRGLSAGAWFEARFASERVPTLIEVYDLAVERGLALDLELKAGANPDALVDTVVEVTDLFWASAANAVARPGGEGLLVTSFDAVMLDRLHRVRPHWVTGLLVGAPTGTLAPWVRRQVDVARTVGARWLLPPLSAVEADPAMWQIPLGLMAWQDAAWTGTTDRIASLPQLAGAIVDEPDRLIRTLRGHGGQATA